MSTTQNSSPAIVRKDGKPVTLVLYQFEGCPFCARVQAEARSLGLSLAVRDTRKDPGALEELLRVGKKKTVPCLFIDGAPLYESSDIIAFLRSEVRASGS